MDDYTELDAMFKAPDVQQALRFSPTYDKQKVVAQRVEFVTSLYQLLLSEGYACTYRPNTYDYRQTIKVDVSPWCFHEVHVELLWIIVGRKHAYTVGELMAILQEAREWEP